MTWADVLLDLPVDGVLRRFFEQEGLPVPSTFEWVDTRASLGHPAILTKDKLDYWLDGEGKVEEMSGVCKGKAYYGIFPT